MAQPLQQARGRGQLGCVARGGDGTDEQQRWWQSRRFPADSSAEPAGRACSGSANRCAAWAGEQTIANELSRRITEERRHTLPVQRTIRVADTESIACLDAIGELRLGGLSRRPRGRKSRVAGVRRQSRLARLRGQPAVGNRQAAVGPASAGVGTGRRRAGPKDGRQQLTETTASVARSRCVESTGGDA